ncbi:MAG: helix-turn-helix transcriptional regulator [Candidatus Neomarinimicrobiota bacterium]|nr:helix-turn-helix transcriptional regulator [Candidatus Neomarinimicrobiota bacterium]
MTLPIKQHRKKLGLTQKALAAKLGVSLPSVVNWENGKISPKGKNLAKVEKFLASSKDAPKKSPKKAVVKPKKKVGRPKGKVGRPKKSATKKAVAKPKGKVGRPSKAAPKVTAPKKRGRPKRRTSAKKSGVSTQLTGVAKDLGFASVDEMVKTILRKHKIGKLDL